MSNHKIDMSYNLAMSTILTQAQYEESQVQRREGVVALVGLGMGWYSRLNAQRSDLPYFAIGQGRADGWSPVCRWFRIFRD